MTRLKLCGLKRRQDIELVNRYLPDYVGFVFAQSPRQVTPKQAADLRGLLKPEILPVGVFVNAEIEAIAALVEEGTIAAVQLHGDETVDYVMKLQQRLERIAGINRLKADRTAEPVRQGTLIKAIRVFSVQEVKKALAYPACYLLFDTYTKGQYGGSGKCFDWQVLKEIERPYFLAGGLSAENVEEAIKEVRPFCVDISSGAETNGIKDEEKIRCLVEKVRRFKMEERMEGKNE
ncbi:MAG: phosphoribosylanthranilate isomerase [Lachnospiraceae bacterium]